MVGYNRTIKYMSTKVGKLTFYHFYGHEGRETEIRAPQASQLLAMSELNGVLVTSKYTEFTEVATTVAHIHLDQKHPVLIAARVMGINEWLFCYGAHMYVSSEWYTYNLPIDYDNEFSLLRAGWIDRGEPDINVLFRYFVASNYVI